MNPKSAIIKFKTSAVYKRCIVDPEKKIEILNNVSDLERQKKY